MPGSIWVLGFVSMFMDIASELVHSLLPVFMATVLGASMMTIGLIEGVTEAAAAVTKVFSGVLSDYFRKRKILVVMGYGLAAMTKPVFPLATTVAWVFGARFIDRIAKGIRGAPRDALIADIVSPKQRGAAYGLRQSLDSVGALLGPLLAVIFMLWWANDIKAVLWIAVVPAALAVVLLLVAVQEPESIEQTSAAARRLVLSDVRCLPLRYWLVVALGSVFTLARFSEAFLVLRAQDLGVTLSFIPAIMIVMNSVYALFAYPLGAMADRMSARTLLVYGLVVLVVADIMLAMAVSPWIAFLGAALWGLHMAFTQGLFAKLVADTSPMDLRGTAFGIFNLVTGGSILLASLIAGWLWHAYDASATFFAGAVFAACAAGGLLLYRAKKRNG